MFPKVRWPFYAVDEKTWRRNTDWFENTLLKRIRENDPDLVRRIRTLYLKPGICGDEVARSIAEALPGNDRVRVVELGDLGLSREGAECLAAALWDDGVVEELDLSWNSVGNRGAEALAALVCGNTPLKELILRHIGIGLEAAATLLCALSYNTFLRTLVLEEEVANFSPEAAAAMVDNMKKKNRRLGGVVTRTECDSTRIDVRLRKFEPILYDESLQALCCDALRGNCPWSEVASWVQNFLSQTPWFFAGKRVSTGWMPLQVQVSGLVGCTPPDVTQALLELLPEVPPKELNTFKPPRNVKQFCKGPLITLCKEAKAKLRSWSDVSLWIKAFPSLATQYAIESARYDVTPLYRACGSEGAPLKVVRDIFDLSPQIAAKAKPRARTEFDWYCEENTAYDPERFPPGNLPLHHAAVREPDPHKEAVLKLLIEAYPPALTTRNRLGWVPLQYAMYQKRWEATRLLLGEKGTAAGEADESGNTALHLAARKGAPDEVLRSLVEARPHLLFSANERGMTPLHYLRQADDRRADRILSYARGLAREPDGCGDLVLHRAVRTGMKWRMGLEQVISLNPSALGMRNGKSDFPFMLSRDTATAFRLLRMVPEAIRSCLDPKL